MQQTPANHPLRYLVLIETAANQHYLFKTNKLRENVGASQLTRQVGEWVGEWARQAAPDIVLATSGKAMIRVADREQGKELIRQVTLRALKEAPGLQLAGAIVPLSDQAGDVIRKVHERLEANRSLMAQTRAPILPRARPCSTSGMPAAGTDKEGENTPFFSAESLAKRRSAHKWRDYAHDLMHEQAQKNTGTQLSLAKDIDQLQHYFDHTQWLGVVVADGNGLGQIFLSLDDHLKTWRDNGGPELDAFAATRQISDELEAAMQRAFYLACQHLHWLDASKPLKRRWKNIQEIPVLPLVLAGDDAVILVEGEYALPFTRTFLREFERATAESKYIKSIAQIALGAGRLSAGAGVALVKHHFPFHLAHELALGLQASAKQVKHRVRTDNATSYPVSALDFHVLFDASYTEPDALREHRMSANSPERERLYGGPYVVTSDTDLAGASAEARAWAEQHHMDHMIERFAVLNARDQDTGRACLPNSQMHALREAVTQGKQIADARLRELRWLDDSGLEALIEGQDSLFVERDDQCVTRFVDAINGAGFWPADPPYMN